MGFTDASLDPVNTMPGETYIEQPITSSDGSVDLTNPEDVTLTPYRVVGFATWDPRSSLPPHSLVEGMGNKIAEMNFSLNRAISSFAGLAVDVTRSDATTGQPKGEALFVVARFILAIIRDQSGTTELTTPDDQRLFQ